MNKLFGVLLTGAGLLPLAVAVAAAPPQALTLPEAEQLALQQEPGVVAARERARAFDERAVAADTLPDPQVRVGVANVPVDSRDLSAEPMTQKLIGVRQQFPPAGSLDAHRREFEYRAGSQQAMAGARAREVRREVRHAWLEVYYWTRAREVIRENRRLFNDSVTVARSLYSVGRQNQQDMIRAELELSRLDDRLLDIEDRLRRNRAALGQWIGRAAERPIADTLPAWDEPGSMESLRRRLLDHPRLDAAQAGVSAAEAGVDAAEARYNPGWAVDLSYGQRDGYDAMGNEREDFASLMFSLDVPLFTGNRQDRQVRAAESERAAALNEKDRLLRELRRDLESAHSRWEQLRFRIDLYDETILQQSRVHTNAAMQAYRNGTGDFADVMRATINDLNSQLEYVRLKTERAKVYAQLDDLAGLTNEDKNHE